MEGLRRRVWIHIFAFRLFLFSCSSSPSSSSPPFFFKGVGTQTWRVGGFHACYYTSGHADHAYALHVFIASICCTDSKNRGVEPGVIFWFCANPKGIAIAAKIDANRTKSKTWGCRKSPTLPRVGLAGSGGSRGGEGFKVRGKPPAAGQQVGELLTTSMSYEVIKLCLKFWSLEVMMSL